MKRITVYVGPRCPHCEAAKAYLDKKGLRYRVVDTATPKGKKLLAATGSRGVPVICIGDTTLRGFSPKAVEKALKGEQKKRPIGRFLFFTLGEDTT